MIAFLPRLDRGLRYSLTGNADQRDDLVQETCARALAHRDQWQPGTRLDSWMFRIAQNLWFDRKRAEKIRGEPVDIEAVDNLSDSDGRAVMESRLALAEVLRGLDQLSPEHRVLIALVCVDGLTYQEASEVSGPTRGDRHEQTGSCPARAPRCDQSSACFQGDYDIGDADVAEISDELLMAYADGALDPADRATVEAALQQHPQYREKVEKVQSDAQIRSRRRSGRSWKRAH